MILSNPFVSLRLQRAFRIPAESPLAYWSKALINWSSIVWALKVLERENALSVTAYGPLITIYVRENVIAGSVLALCVLQVVWLIFRLPQYASCIAGYVALLVGWSGIMYAVAFASPPQPTAFATVSSMCFVAWCALVTRLPDGAA